MAEWHQWCQGKLVSPPEAVSDIRSGEKVAFGMAHPPGTLWAITEALAQRKDELRGTKLVSSVSFPPGPWQSPGVAEAFDLGMAAFPSRDRRRGDPEGRGIPETWSFRNPNRLLEPGRASMILGADWAVVPVGVPNRNGYMSFGHDVWFNLSMARTAKHVIGVVHPHFPRTYGDGIHLSEVTCLVESVPTPSDYVVAPATVLEDKSRVAEVLCALASELIRDGDTLEIGMGDTALSLPEFLTHKNDLGFHSEVLSPETILNLVKPGIANGRRKNINRGKCVLGVAQYNVVGPWFDELQDFVDENPHLEFRDLSYINNPTLVASHDNMVAVNIAPAMDLRGQIAGLVPVAGLAGQLDFVVGSHYSRGGRSITLLPSSAEGGKASRIVPAFTEGTLVNVLGLFVDYLVTEHGVVNLEGRTLRQRAEAIISVAHPNFQPELRQAAKKMFGP